MKGGIEKCSSALKNLLKILIVKIIPPVEVYNSGYFLFGFTPIYEIMFKLLSPDAGRYRGCFYACVSKEVVNHVSDKKCNVNT